MVYIQFFHNGAVSVNLLFEACGSNSIYHVDGRLSLNNMYMQAKKECIQRKYAGFQIRKGKSYTDYTNLTDIISI